MKQSNFEQLAVLAQEPQAVQRTIAYLKQHLGRFLRQKDRVLICFPQTKDTFCRILDAAVLACGATPVWVGDDRRWITLLKTAFTQKCSCIIGPPLMVLGLSKVAKYMGIPLYVRNALLAGYPSTQWMVEGVKRNLDCQVWGCFDSGSTVIAGFSCGHTFGVHLRTEEYGVEIVDDEGQPMQLGELGNVVIFPRTQPNLRCWVGDVGKLETGCCPCGQESPRLVEINTRNGEGQDLADLGEQLHYWSSVLDCRMRKTEYGLELEMVVFSGEKLPVLPTAAKRILRNFDPEMDEPFAHHAVLKERYFSQIPH